jgi:hypothetical protein
MRLLCEKGKEIIAELLDSDKPLGEILTSCDLSPGEKVVLMGDLSFLVESIQKHLGLLQEQHAHGYSQDEH